MVIKVKDSTGDETSPYNEVNGSLTKILALRGADSDQAVNQVEVENNTGSVLPSTGGIGTTIFYIVGGILVVGACIMLIARRNAGSEK